MQKFLTEIEIEKIENMCKDEVLVGAIKKVLLQGVYSQGVIQKGFEHDPLTNAAFNLASLSVTNPIPDEELGANIRGMWAGVNYIKNAFDSLLSIKAIKAEPVETPYNEAE